MPGRSPTTQRIDDATARAITNAQVLAEMELWVRGQLRRGYMNADEYTRVLDDIQAVRAQVASHRAELAELRNGTGGKP